MGSPFIDLWVHSTMLIVNQWGEHGTGFLVRRAVTEDGSRVFLVTNKHVLHSDPTQRKKATYIYLHHNVQGQDDHLGAFTTQFAWDKESASRAWREHPENDVDVLAFEVTSLIVENPSLVWQSPTYDLFVDENNSRQWDITVSDDILVVGYPLGFSQGVTNLPLVRSGIIATRIDQAIRDDFLEPNGTRRQRTLPGFLFDGATIPGSSGSPVILKPTPSRLINGAMVTAYVPALLLGIVAETRYAPIQVGTNSIPSFAGLGLAFHAETIKETIELFFTV